MTTANMRKVLCVQGMPKAALDLYESGCCRWASGALAHAQ